MPEEAVFLSVITLGLLGVLLWPLARGLGERLRPRPGALDPDVRQEITRLREALDGELQQLRHEVAELAERVDFTERLLAQHREAERLPPGP